MSNFGAHKTLVIFYNVFSGVFIYLNTTITTCKTNLSQIVNLSRITSISTCLIFSSGASHERKFLKWDLYKRLDRQFFLSWLITIISLNLDISADRPPSPNKNLDPFKSPYQQKPTQTQPKWHCNGCKYYMFRWWS